MAFENSSASDPKDLLQKLYTFLTAHGWTGDASRIEGSGWRAHVHKGGVYVHMRATYGEFPQWLSASPDIGYGISLYCSTSYTDGNPWNGQTAGAPTQVLDITKVVGAGMALLPGAIANYYFFADATNDNIVVVVQKQSGVYAHMGWGTSLAKVGTWTGGPYFFGSSGGYSIHYLVTAHVPGKGTITAACPGTANDGDAITCTFVRADVDAFTGQWISLTTQTNGIFGATGKNGSSSVVGDAASIVRSQEFPIYGQVLWNQPGDFQTSQTSQMDGRANLLPVLLWARRDGSGTGYSLIGSIPSIFCTNAVGNGFAPASDYVIGADTYTLFPNFAVKKA